VDILFLLIPLGLVLVGIIAWFFVWSVNHRQFEDLEGPAHEILMDNDKPARPPLPSTDKKDATPSTRKS
jgi:cbb3-type cytochrome oxidase maturation protein